MADLGGDLAWKGVAGDAGDGLQQNWWVEAFKDEMIHLAQQRGSKLRPKIKSRSITGEATYFERLGNDDPVAVTARLSATPNLDVPHSRRKVVMNDFRWGKAVDEMDKRRMLVNPIGPYTEAAGFAMGRQWDDLIIAGATGTALDGTGASIAYDTVNQQVPAGGVGFTLDKFLAGKQIMDDNDVPRDQRCLVISPQEERALLNLTEITSLDYNMRPTLVEGRVPYYLGYDIIVMTRLVDDATNRNCFMFQKNCLGLAYVMDTKVRVGERPDLSYATQVYSEFAANATRIDDAGVVSILCAIA